MVCPLLHIPSAPSKMARVLDVIYERVKTSSMSSEETLGLFIY